MSKSKSTFYKYFTSANLLLSCVFVAFSSTKAGQTNLKSSTCSCQFKLFNELLLSNNLQNLVDSSDGDLEVLSEAFEHINKKHISALPSTIEFTSLKLTNLPIRGPPNS